MTGEICLACGHRRPRARCPIRCGVILEPAAGIIPAPPASRARKLAENATACVAICGGLTALGLPLWSLAGQMP
jgi:hypothetical protein